MPFRGLSIIKPSWYRYPLHSHSICGRTITCRDGTTCLVPYHTLSCKAARAASDTARIRLKDLVPTADTIYALSTAAGRAAIAVIRVSGPACLDIFGGLCPNTPFPIPRTTTLRRLRDPNDFSRVLDSRALVLYFPSPKTATGEDVLEFHVHGGLAIVQSVLEAIPQCVNSRPRRRTAEYSHVRAAEPGEFTKRAFYNGRLDLTQAEALGETLAAETEQQRRLAVAGAGSDLSKRYEQWRTQLLHARGELEALIDFSEDQHFDESPAQFIASVARQVMALKEQIGLHIRNASRGELLRSGINVALLGAPNAGKSSLLNRIIGREAAIVSNEAGTTRDIVDVNVNLGGWLVKLGDMAGIRTTVSNASLNEVSSEKLNVQPDIGAIEREGIRRARERALQSDLVIVLVALKTSANNTIELELNSEIINCVRQCHTAGKEIVYVINKADLLKGQDENKTKIIIKQTLLELLPALAQDTFFLSCTAATKGQEIYRIGHSPPLRFDPGGLQHFLNGLKSKFATMTSAAVSGRSNGLSNADAQAYWNISLAITHRQSEHLSACFRHLDDFLEQTTVGMIRDRWPYDPGRRVRLSHHVDDHDDLVGEVTLVVNEIDGHRAGGILGSTHDRQAMPETVAQAENHPRASADNALDPRHFSLDEAETDLDVVKAAEHLRYAGDCLAKITGRGIGGEVEDVLGVVFEK